jgi:hypothetical protein
MAAPRVDDMASRRFHAMEPTEALLGSAYAIIHFVFVIDQLSKQSNRQIFWHKGSRSLSIEEIAGAVMASTQPNPISSLWNISWQSA